MIFNNIGYLVKNNTRNSTNTKDYSYLNNDFIYDVTFKYKPINTQQIVENCVLGRTGYPFGIYTIQSDYLKVDDPAFSYLNNTFKWVWFSKVNNEILYNDIFFGVGNTEELSKNHLKWWKKFILNNSPIEIEEDITQKLCNRWGGFDNSFLIEDITNKELKEWAEKIENGRKETGSYITDIVNVSIKKENSMFKMYVNDIFYFEKEVGDIVDISDKTICIGIDDPYKDSGDIQYFNGELYNLSIYNDSIRSNHTLYCSFDFKTKTHFKLFDLSKNGNHAELYETQEQIHKKNEEFNEVGRPGKIN